MKRETLPISVVIATRNRGADVVNTVLCLRNNRFPGCEIVVVDQSDGDQTKLALEGLLNTPGLLYHRMPPQGLSAARNVGVEMSSGTIIAMTDDDCLPSANWLHVIQAVFRKRPRVGLVFTIVFGHPHDKSRGFVPAYSRKTPFLATSIRQKHHIEGIGAAMAFRRSAWERIQGFDTQLGAGGKYCSAEELDFALRLLQSGFHVYETPQTHVVHLGFRTWQQSPALIRGYLRGIGAAYAKHLKSWRFSVLLSLWYLFWRWALGRPVVDLGRTPPRMLRIRAFAKGMWDAVRAPVDRRYVKFIHSDLPNIK